MATNSQPPQEPKRQKINGFGVSWIYILLLVGIVYMFFHQGGANPQKVEWDDVKTQILAGDVKEVAVVRNACK